MQAFWESRRPAIVVLARYAIWQLSRIPLQSAKHFALGRR